MYVLFVTWYLPSIFLEPPKNYLTLLYRLPCSSQNKWQIKIYACSANDMTASNYRFMVSKKLSRDIDLQGTSKWNLSNFIIVVVAKCYSEKLNISKGFGGANSLISGYFCPPRGRIREDEGGREDEGNECWGLGNGLRITAAYPD